MIIERINLETLEKINNAIPINYEKYMKEDKYWLTDFITELGYAPLPGGMEIKDFYLEIDENDPVSKDFTNAKILYENLKLSPELASNGAFWTILAHHFIKYIRIRGKYSEKSKEKAIDRLYKDVCFSDYLTKRERRESYLCRLWSIVDLTINNNDFDNPYELTELVFKEQDLVNTILDRSIYTNRNVTRAFLELYRDRMNNGEDISRKTIRDFQVYLNALSDICVIEALSLDDLREKFKEFIEWDERKNPE